MGGLQSAYLEMEEVSDKKKKARAEKFANSRRGQRMMKSRRMQKYTEDRNKSLQKGADLRAAQEANTTKGERVWFSRCILNGSLQHWVLMTHGSKYELRRDRNAPHGEARYVSNIKNYSIDQERRDMALAELGIPDLDGYYVCLIGWTRLSKEEVDAACRETLASFGDYSLLRNNCQHFLKRVAERILVKDKAADYDWFMSNTKTQYQKDQWLKPPPAEMMMHILAQHAAVAANQNQNQIQLQMQMQMQMQMQSQMMAQQAGGMGA